MTTINKTPHDYRSRNGYDPSAPSTITFVKHALGMVVKDPRAFHIHITLATYYSGASQTGVIRPSTPLMMHQHNLTETEYADALAHLVLSGHWLIAFVSNVSNDESFAEHNLWRLPHEEVKQYLLNRGLHNIDRYIPTFVENVIARQDRTRSEPGSLNHGRLLTRYLPMKAGLATALQLGAIQRIKSRYNDMGYWKFGKTPFNYKNGKIIHQTWFDHPMLKASTLEEVTELASVKHLTDEMVSKSFHARISFAEIAEKFDLGEAPVREITRAIVDIRRAGYFEAEVKTTRGSDAYKLVLILTPTKKTHDTVWDFDFHRGMAQHEWEKRNGHQPDAEPVVGDNPYENLPPLGYHYLYLLKSRKTGQFLSVGQSSTPLRARLRRHQVHGTTIRLENLIKKINQDPTDSLEIVYAGTVHHNVCAEHEMRTLWKMQELGHEVVNDIDDILQNLDTIQLDRRYDRYTRKGLEYVLRKTLERHGEVIELLPLPGEAQAELIEEPAH